ncbi:hypothetical protein ACJIZ3_019714 [Penstemon smallii]|uniref:LOB domain-containing protein n=1 Tax=Penstemon smallii TaxID=265156 RepID=A0ABD3T1W5_9LAMI
MRMSCNGCRVLRKGCSEDCTLRPCLEWINTPTSQANATLFLAKFYGRAGLINLINAGPAHLRSDVFRSLLFEACGRIINPVYGSVGLMCSGQWQRCQEAVEAVLQGSPPVKIGGDDDSSTSDIRHVSKETAASLHRVRNPNRFKRSGPKSHVDEKFTITGWEYKRDFEDELNRAPSQDSFSVETVEPSLVNRDREPVREVKPEPDCNEIELELTLGLNPVRQTYMSTVIQISDSEA